MTHSKTVFATCLVLLLSLGVGCRKKARKPPKSLGPKPKPATKPEATKVTVESNVRAFCEKNSLTLVAEWGENDKPLDRSVAKALGRARVFEATLKVGQGQRYMLLHKANELVLNVGNIGDGATVVALLEALALKAESEESATRLTKLASQLMTNNAMQKGCVWSFTVDKSSPYHVSGSCKAPNNSHDWILQFKAGFDNTGRLNSFVQIGFK